MLMTHPVQLVASIVRPASKDFSLCKDLQLHVQVDTNLKGGANRHRGKLVMQNYANTLPLALINIF